MGLPLEVFRECYTKIWVVLDLLEYVVADGVKVWGFIIGTEQIAFFRVEFQSPLLGPCLKVVQVLLESEMIIGSVDGSVQQTVISKEANLWSYSFG